MIRVLVEMFGAVVQVGVGIIILLVLVWVSKSILESLALAQRKEFELMEAGRKKREQELEEQKRLQALQEQKRLHAEQWCSVDYNIRLRASSEAKRLADLAHDSLMAKYVAASKQVREDALHAALAPMKQLINESFLQALEAILRVYATKDPRIHERRYLNSLAIRARIAVETVAMSLRQRGEDLIKAEISKTLQAFSEATGPILDADEGELMKALCNFMEAQIASYRPKPPDPPPPAFASLMRLSLSKEVSHRRSARSAASLVPAFSQQLEQELRAALSKLRKDVPELENAEGRLLWDEERKQRKNAAEKRRHQEELNKQRLKRQEQAAAEPEGELDDDDDEDDDGEDELTLQAARHRLQQEEELLYDDDGGEEEELILQEEQNQLQQEEEEEARELAEERENSPAETEEVEWDGYGEEAYDE